MTADDRLIAEIDKQAMAFGVTGESIMGRDRSRRASAARRAVWAGLVTRHPGGAFSVAKLSELFDRQVNIVRAGIAMHEKKLLSWPRGHQGPIEIEGSNAEFTLQRRLRLLRARYAGLRNQDPLRAPIRAECARIKARLAQLGVTP